MILIDSLISLKREKFLFDIIVIIITIVIYYLDIKEKGKGFNVFSKRSQKLRVIVGCYNLNSVPA